MPEVTNFGKGLLVATVGRDEKVIRRYIAGRTYAAANELVSGHRPHPLSGGLCQTSGSTGGCCSLELVEVIPLRANSGDHLH